MSIKIKKGGAYSDVAGIYVKKNGVYQAVAGVYVKKGGAYYSSSGGIASTNSTTLIGDSRMAYGNPPLNFSVPNVGGGTSVSHVDWLNDAERLAGGVGFDCLFMRAVGGVNLVTIRDVQVPLALADTTDIVWCHGGVNSFNNGISGFDTLDNNVAVAKQIIDQLRAVKKIVIFDSIDPVDQGGITGAKPRWAEFPQFNSQIQAYCAQFGNVIFNDTFSALVDTVSPVNNPIPNVIQTADGIHNTTYGGQVQGAASRSNIMQKLSLTKYKTPGANVLSPMGTTGGTTTIGSGTITGSAPANWNVQVVSGAAAVVLSQPSAGVTRMVITNGAGAASTIYLQATNVAALQAIAGAGVTLQAGVQFAVSALSGLTRVAVTKRFSGANGTLWNCMSRDTSIEPDAVAKFPTTPFSGLRVVKPYSLQGVPSSTEFIIAVNTATNGSATIDFSNPTFNVLT